MSKSSTILYFGQITDHTLVNEESMDLGELTVANFTKQIEEQYPGLAHTFYRVAVDQEIREHDFTIKAGSEIAILPQFAGG